MTRKGDWVQMFSGGQFWPLDPRAVEIKLIDVAVGLSRECRFGNQCRRWYSVAEHSIHMTLHAMREGADARTARCALFHDSSEGVTLKDMVRPLKRRMLDYKAIESGVMLAVAERFDFDWPMPHDLKVLDERIGLTEQRDNMAPPPAPWAPVRFEASGPLPVELRYWSPGDAFNIFMNLAVGLGVRDDAA